MSHVSIWDIISVKMRRENWCRIDTWLETPVTRNINTLWQSNAVLCYYARDCGLCLCGLTAVGAYIHSAASSPKGGENVIYTLIMPAPLNTPLARCNILDISTSLSLPLSSSFSAFHINPHTSWAPCWYLLSSSWIQSSASTDVLLWSVYIFMYVCSICTTPCLCQLLSLSSSCASTTSSKCILNPSIPITALCKKNFQGDWETSPATTPQCPLPWGIKGWLSCDCLSQWDYLLLTVAYYDTFLHSLTHTLSHSGFMLNTSLLSPPFTSWSCSVSASFPFILPSYSMKGTLHWRAAECQDFIQHFDWLKAVRTSIPSLTIGPKAHIDNAPSHPSRFIPMWL